MQTLPYIIFEKARIFKIVVIQPWKEHLLLCTPFSPTYGCPLKVAKLAIWINFQFFSVGFVVTHDAGQPKDELESMSPVGDCFCIKHSVWTEEVAERKVSHLVTWMGGNSRFLRWWLSFIPAMKPHHARTSFSKQTHQQQSASRAEQNIYICNTKRPINVSAVWSVAAAGGILGHHF